MTDAWIKKMWYIYTMEYYPATKKNDTGSFAMFLFFVSKTEL